MTRTDHFINRYAGVFVVLIMIGMVFAHNDEYKTLKCEKEHVCSSFDATK